MRSAATTTPGYPCAALLRLNLPPAHHPQAAILVLLGVILAGPEVRNRLPIAVAIPGPLHAAKIAAYPGGPKARVHSR